MHRPRPRVPVLRPLENPQLADVRGGGIFTPLIEAITPKKEEPYLKYELKNTMVS